MDPGFEDDFTPMQGSNGVQDDAPFILGDEDSPKKTLEGEASFIFFLKLLNQLGPQGLRFVCLIVY